MGKIFGNSVVLIGFLIEWAIGLRAAVAIASERERGSWDGLLTSPLEGGEIVRGKLYGSLFAIRWLLLATAWAWTLTVICGAMSVQVYAFAMVGMVVYGAFMAAVGVRASLATNTATRAMAITIGTWLGALALGSVLALFVVVVVILFFTMLWYLGIQLGWTSWNRAPWFPLSFSMGFMLTRLAIHGLATAAIVAEARLRFDRIAGRSAGGTAQVAVDRLLHGRPMAPIPVEALSGRPRPTANGVKDERDAREASLS